MGLVLPVIAILAGPARGAAGRLRGCRRTGAAGSGASPCIAVPCRRCRRRATAGADTASQARRRALQARRHPPAHHGDRNRRLPHHAAPTSRRFRHATPEPTTVLAGRRPRANREPQAVRACRCAASFRRACCYDERLLLSLHHQPGIRGRRVQRPRSRGQRGRSGRRVRCRTQRYCDRPRVRSRRPDDRREVLTVLSPGVATSVNHHSGDPGMRVFLVNPSHVSFGTAVITPRWLFVLAAATPARFGDPVICDETLDGVRPAAGAAGRRGRHRHPHGQCAAWLRGRARRA